MIKRVLSNDTLFGDRLQWGMENFWRTIEKLPSAAQKGHISHKAYTYFVGVRYVLWLRW